MITVLILNTDAAVGAALIDLLGTDPDISVLAPTDEGSRLDDAVRADVAIVDLHVSAGKPTLIQALRERSPDLAIICFSADETARDQALAAGADAFAIKGDRHLDLLALVHETARRRR